MFLDNVEINNNIISADYYYPDEKEDVGHIDYSIDEDEFVDVKYTKRDADKEVKYPVGLLINAFRNMVKYNRYPKTYRYIWY